MLNKVIDAMILAGTIFWGSVGVLGIPFMLLAQVILNIKDPNAELMYRFSLWFPIFCLSTIPIYTIFSNKKLKLFYLLVPAMPIIYLINKGIGACQIPHFFIFC